MQEWETLMGQAKSGYQESAYELAIQLNRSALTLARDKFDGLFSQDPDKALASMLVSHFSLTDGLLAKADYEAARYQLITASDFLFSVVQRAGNMTENERLALLRGLQRLRFECLHFAQQIAKQLMPQDPRLTVNNLDQCLRSLLQLQENLH
jgi:hypothetical protein